MANPAAAHPETDGEVHAMLTCVAVLDPLDHAARTRVVAYAQARFVDREPLDFEPEGFANFAKALREASNQLGDFSVVDIVKAALELQRIRDEQADNG